MPSISARTVCRPGETGVAPAAGAQGGVVEEEAGIAGHHLDFEAGLPFEVFEHIGHGHRCGVSATRPGARLCGGIGGGEHQGGGVARVGARQIGVDAAREPHQGQHRTRRIGADLAIGEAAQELGLAGAGRIHRGQVGFEGGLREQVAGQSSGLLGRDRRFAQGIGLRSLEAPEHCVGGQQQDEQDGHGTPRRWARATQGGRAGAIYNDLSCQASFRKLENEMRRGGGPSPHLLLRFPEAFLSPAAPASPTAAGPWEALGGLWRAWGGPSPHSPIASGYLQSELRRGGEPPPQLPHQFPEAFLSPAAPASPTASGPWEAVGGLLACRDGGRGRRARRARRSGRALFRGGRLRRAR
jgi:hypothetical protein